MAKKEVAVGKRIKISKYQKQTIGLVLVAAVVLGVCVVVAVFLIKYIGFNAKVITEKENAVAGYDTAIKNAAKLKAEVLGLAENEDLESVGRDTLTECYNENGKRIDYSLLYQQASDEEEAEQQLKLMKKCSALRVIPEALPAKQNDEALMSSLDQIFRLSDWEPESLSPSGTATSSSITGLEVIPVSLSIEADTETTFRVLDNIERSIRSIDIMTSTIAWRDTRLELKAQAMAYYADDVSVVETPYTVYATDEARKAGVKK